MNNDELATLKARISRLEDLEEIRALVGRYGRAVDDRDWDSLSALYSPDAVFESAGTRASGNQAVVDFVRERTSAYSASYHYPHSHEISLVDDNTATGVVCAHAELAISGETVWVALQYHDDYSRGDGRWYFRERVTRILYVLKVSEISTGFSDRLRIRWPGTDPAPAQIGADVSSA